MEINYVDPICIQDVFASRMAKVENLGGGNFRFIFVTHQEGENLVVARLVLHMDSVAPAILMAATAIGMAMVCETFKGARLH